MNCAEKIAAIFDGEFVDKVPFALKGWRTPRDETTEMLLKKGMCVVGSASVYSSYSPNVKGESETFEKDGATYHRSIIKTPKGNLTSMSKSVPSPRTESTSWRVEMPFKTPDDYDVLEFMARDRKYKPNYEAFLKAQESDDGTVFFKTGAPGSPLHTIMYQFMDMETFSIEWAERRDRIIALHDAMAENEREIFHIVAKSPAKVVQCGGNYSPEVLGKDRFMDFVLPHWEEVGAIFHEEGKMLGCHLDANNKLWAKEVGDSGLDWIEAFTPAPDTDLTLAEARKMWAGKVFYINFPSSVHVQSADVIAETTRQLLKESAPGDRFIIGITENVPDNRWRESFNTIMDTISEYGKLPII